MADGLPSHLGDIGSESILDASISTADIADSQVTTAKIAANAVTAAKHAFIGTGSPTGYGLSVQTGEFVTSAGSVYAAAFGTAFAAAPIAFASVTKDSTGWAAVSAVNATGLDIISEAASQSGAWIAVGSGAL